MEHKTAINLKTKCSFKIKISIDIFIFKLRSHSIFCIQKQNIKIYQPLLIFTIVLEIIILYNIYTILITRAFVEHFVKYNVWQLISQNK